MRILLRVLSPLLGLAVGVLGGLVALEAGWALARPDSDPLVGSWRDLQDDLAGHDWTETPVTVTASIAIAVGVLLIGLAASARRHDVVLTDPAPGVTVVTSPRSLARVVGHRARATDGVRSASVTASARTIKVRAGSGLYREEQLRPVLATELDELVAAIPFEHPPKVLVVIDSTKDRP